MNEPRFIYREEPLPEPESHAYRQREIETLESIIGDMLEDLRNAEQQLQELRNSPLPTTIKVCQTLRPGDEGYEDAPIRMDTNPFRYEFP